MVRAQCPCQSRNDLEDSKEEGMEQKEAIFDGARLRGRASAASSSSAPLDPSEGFLERFFEVDAWAFEREGFGGPLRVDTAASAAFLEGLDFRGDLRAAGLAAGGDAR